MSVTNGHKAIIARIVAQAGATAVALPNGPGKSLPRYVVQEAGGTQSNSMVAGLTDADAEVVVRVETVSGSYATQSNDLTAALVAMFPAGLRFGTSPAMTILTPPNVRPPLPVIDGVYSVPVVVRARFTF